MARPGPHDWVNSLLEFHRRTGAVPLGYLPQLPAVELQRVRKSDLLSGVTALLAALGAAPSWSDQRHDPGEGVLEYEEIGTEWNEEEPDLNLIAHRSVELIQSVIELNLIYGIDLRPVFQEVFRALSAMEYVPGEGLVAPDGWVPPDIASAMSTQPPLRPLSKEGT